MERIANKKIFQCYERVMGQRAEPQDKEAIIAFAEAIIYAERGRIRAIYKRKIEVAKGSNKALGDKLSEALKKKCDRCGLTDGCSVGCGE